MFKNGLYYLVAGMVMIVALNGCSSTLNEQSVVKSFNLNHIFEQIAIRLSTVVEARIGQ